MMCWHTKCLPPLPEQQRIVARIESLVAMIEEAKRSRTQAVAETGHLSHLIGSATNELLDQLKYRSVGSEM
jgi:hypothetical protein